MATKLKDARIVVKLDTRAAQAEAEKARAGKERKDDQKSDRGERRREERKKQKEKQGGLGKGVAVGAGLIRGRLGRVLKGLVALRAFEEAAGIGAGFIKEAGRGKTIASGIPGVFIDVEKITEEASQILADLSRAVAAATSLLGAVLATTGQVKDVAFSQQLLTGKVDFEALGEFAVRAGNVNIAQARFAALKGSRGREAAGAILAEAAEAVKQRLFGMIDGGQN